jgi:hypothetical protein
MPSTAEMLARLRVAALTGHLPADVAEWVLERLEDPEQGDDHRQRRDATMRALAASIPGTTWARARRLHRRFGVSHRQARRILGGR